MGTSVFQPIFIATQADFPLQPTTFVQKDTVANPYAVAVINGKRYEVVDATISANAHGATGTAVITLSIGNNPDFSQELFRGTLPLSGSTVPLTVPSAGALFSIADLNSGGPGIENNSPVYVQIYFGFPSSLSSATDITQLTLVWYGVVDQYSAKFTQDQVTFASRSFAAPLIDNDVTRVSMAETSVAFLQNQAEAIGMNFVPVLPAGYQPITIQQVLGREFVGGSNFSAALYGKKIWDLGLSCALFDNADMWVWLNTLYYAAPNLVQRQTIPLAYGADIEEEGGLLGTHSPQAAKNVQIELHTYQPRTRFSHSVQLNSTDDGYTTQATSRLVTSQPVFGTPDSVTTSVSADGTVTVTSTQQSGGSFSSTTGIATESGKERYVYFVRNQAPGVLNNLAQSLWRFISQHEYSIAVDVALTPQLLSQLNISSKLQLSGVPYRYFNDVYYPRSMTLRISPDEGARVRFEAVNHLLPQGAV